MRVLTYTSLFPNSTDPEHGIFIYQRMAHFAKRPGNAVTVVAPVPWAPPWFVPKAYKRYRKIPLKEQFGSLTVHHPRYFVVPGISMPFHGLSMLAGSLPLLRKLHKTHQFDLIDSHYVYPDGFAAALAGRLLRLPVVVSARGTDMNLFPQFRTIRPMIRWTLQNVAGAIGVCTPLLEAMVMASLPTAKGTVVGNGIDLERFQPIPKEAARANLGIAREQKVFIAVGSLIPRKGFQYLIPAFAIIVRKEPNSVLYIIGEGNQRRELERLVANEGIADRVFMPGKRPNEELRWWYSAADVSCLVSSREGWPNVLLESFACGTPVVATSVWGVPEVLASPELGILVEQNIDSIANGLRQSLKKCWNRENLMAYARGRTWDDVAAELHAWLQHCLVPAHTITSLG